MADSGPERPEASRAAGCGRWKDGACLRRKGRRQAQMAAVKNGGASSPRGLGIFSACLKYRCCLFNPVSGLEEDHLDCL